jgi:heptaprenyl diphosphate synthase
VSSGINWGPDVDEGLSARLDEGMDRVEEMLRDIVKSQHALLTRASQHLMLAGGKRFRPMLALLTAEFGDVADARVVPGAVACELTHLASLYHDDVMDEADVRRGQPTANILWGNKMAILTGDFLFAQAAEIGLELGPKASELYNRVAKRLIFGQFREMVGPGPNQDKMDHYLHVVTEKTGVLIRASCEVGALMSGVDPELAEALGEFGEQLGVAFQFADDLIDVAADAEQLGKRPGNDLRAKVASLPVLHFRAMATAEDARLSELLDSDLAEDDAALEEALSLLRKHPAMTRTQEDLDERVDRCLAILDGVPAIPARSALTQLAESMRDRRS